MPRLGVLTDHVHILEGALQGMPLVNGGRTGSVVDGVNHLDRQPNSASWQCAAPHVGPY